MLTDLDFKEYLRQVKKIDIHAHLGDVCGVGSNHFIEKKKNNNQNLLVSSDFNVWISKIILSPFFPNAVLKREIARICDIGTLDKMLQSMRDVNCEKVFLLPIEPFVSSSQLYNEIAKYDDQISVCASINFELHKSYDDIYNFLVFQVKNFRCPAIKFHPNIQNVDPKSSQALCLYEAAMRLGLPIIIHGGMTPFLKGKRRYLARVRSYVDIFSSFKNLKVIFAHLGQYFEQDDRLFSIAIRHANIFLDCSGVSSARIVSALQKFDLNRIIYGSDWPFATHLQSLEIFEKAICKFTRKKNTRETVSKKIMHDNYCFLINSNQPQWSLPH